MLRKYFHVAFDCGTRPTHPSCLLRNLLPAASLLHQGTQEASDLSSDDTTRNSEDEHGTNSDDNWIRSEESEIDSGNLDDDSIGSFMRRRTAY